jgi:hypothetical protein
VCVGLQLYEHNEMGFVSEASALPYYRLAIFIVTADWRIYSGGLVLARIITGFERLPA